MVFLKSGCGSPQLEDLVLAPLNKGGFSTGCHKVAKLSLSSYTAVMVPAENVAYTGSLAARKKPFVKLIEGPIHLLIQPLRWPSETGVASLFIDADHCPLTVNPDLYLDPPP